MAKRGGQATTGDFVLAAIDVGTNSVHMVVARASLSGFDVLTTEKEMVRLGSGGDDTLTVSAMDRAIDALRRMRNIADALGAQVRAVATSAVRESKNSKAFLNRVLDETGIVVEVISGQEEARLIFLGVSHCLSLGDDSTLMVDIGGGSTEFSLSQAGHLNFAQSLKLGAVRLNDLFLDEGLITPEAVARIERHVASKFSMISHDLRAASPTRVVVSSGTCESIARMVSARRPGSAPLSMNGFVFTGAEFEEVADEILACPTPKDRSALQGLDAKRSDIIASGVLILREIVRSLGINTLEYSDFSLREGLMIDSINNRFGVSNREPDASLDSVLRLARRCSVDLVHSGHVAELSTQLFHGLGDIYEIDTSRERLLVAAAQLANAGAAVSYSKHHLHSYYVIRHSDLLGFTDEEIETIALVARYHRKSPPRISHPEFAAISGDQRAEVVLLSGILRVATALDRSHDQSVTSVECEMLPTPGSERGLRITVRKKRGAGDREVELNLMTSQERKGPLQSFLGEEIQIVLGH